MVRTHQRLFYVDNVNIMGVSVHTIKKSTEALVVAIKEIGLEVNTCSRVEIRMQKAAAIQKLLVVPLKG